MAVPHTEKRKYARFDTSVEVMFEDRKRTTGKLANISRKGCLIVPNVGHLRAIGSLVIFRVFVHGSPGDKQLSAESKKTNESAATQVNQLHETIKVIAKVNRHVNYKGKPAMSAELFGLDGDDILKWNDFLVKSTRKLISFSHEHSAPYDAVVTAPIYQIRFKNMEHVRRFLPSELTGVFFLETATSREVGQLIKLKLMHPNDTRQVLLDTVVEKFGNHPQKIELTGLLLRYKDPSAELSEKMNAFLDYELYK